MSQNIDQKVNEVASQDQPDRGNDHWLRERREQEAQKAQEHARQAAQQQQQLSATQIEVQNDWFIRSIAHLV